MSQKKQKTVVPGTMIRVRNTRHLVKEGAGEYSWKPLCERMPMWVDYMTNVIEDGELDRMCIIQITEERWIASDNTIRPTTAQIAELLTNFNWLLRGKLQIGDWRTFHTTTNDGEILEAVGGKHEARNEILVVGRTKQYLILAGHNIIDDNDRCKNEVKFVKNHLKSLGK